MLRRNVYRKSMGLTRSLTKGAIAELSPEPPAPVWGARVPGPELRRRTFAQRTQQLHRSRYGPGPGFGGPLEPP